MANTIDAPDPTQPWIDPETGLPTIYFASLLEELLAGTSTNSIGTVLSGANSALAQSDGIIASQQEEAEQGLATDVTVTTDFAQASGFGTGTVTTASISISVAGGTPPYNISWAYVSGHTYTPNSPVSLSADGSFDVTFTRTVDVGQFYTGVQKVTVTDSAGSPLMGELAVTVTMVDPQLSVDDVTL